MKIEREKYIIPGILVLALGLRLHFLGFLLPYFEFNDETDLVRSALNIIRTGDLNPHFFFYGSFPIYWSVLLFFPALYVYWWISGTGLSFHLFLAGFDYHQGGMFLFYLGRLTSVFFGVGSVYLIYLAGKELFDRRSGRLAALLLAVCPFHIYFSQLYKVDSSFLFWFLLVVYFSVRIYRRGGWKNYLLAGLFAGLVLSTRYNFIVFFPILAAALSREGWRGMIRPGLWISVYAAGVIFLLTCPYAVLDLSNFLEQMRIQMTLDQKQVVFFRTDSSHWFYRHYLYQLIFIFPAFFGPLVYLTSYAGFRELWVSDRRVCLILISYPVLFFAFSGGYSELVMPQYQISLLPFAIFGACGWMAERIWRNTEVKKWAVWLVLLVSLVFYLSDIFIPHFKEVYYVYREAGQWINQEIPKDKKVVSYSWVYSVTDKFRFQDYYQIHQASNFNYQDMQKFDPDFLVLADLAVLHAARFADLYQDYLRLLKALDQGELKGKYKLIKTFKPDRWWERVAGMVFPDLKSFRINIYQKM